MVEIDREYLDRKHQGGESSQRGNLFESYFAVYQILLLMAHGKDDAQVFSQVKGAYVDDLLVLYDGRFVYHQIKDVKTLSWGKLEVWKSLASDFYNQAEVCISKKVNFLLKLIVSSGKDKLIEKMPLEIRVYSMVEEFPAYNNINRYVFDSEFYSIAIKAMGLMKSSYYVVSTFVTMLFGKWCGGVCAGKDVKTIIQDVWQALIGFGIDEMALEKVKKRLGLLGFSFEQDSSILHWKYLEFEGDVELTEQKVEEILEATDAESMINVLF